MRVPFVFAICASLAAPAATLANTLQGCNATWAIRAGTTELEFGRFEAHGNCKAQHRSDLCLRYAKSVAQDCFIEAWDAHWIHEISAAVSTPPSCIKAGEIEVLNYGVSNLKEEVMVSACALPFAKPFKVQVVGKTWAGEYCTGEIFVGTYTVREDMCAQA